MSLSSKIDGGLSIPLSISEVNSSYDSGESMDCYSSPNLGIKQSPALLPLKDFKESIENEKNIRLYLTKFESLQIPNAMRNGKLVEVLEKNYKLQVQTLLEEVNQLKLDKKILEKKMEKAQKGPASPGRSKNDFAAESVADDSMLKKTLEAKNSTIKELEFQLSQANKENNNLKMRLEAQGKQVQDFLARIADAENLREELEEKNQEIADLRSNLEAEEARQDRFLKELSLLKNENIALKLKSQCLNCGQPATGTNSFANPLFYCFSKDQSFFSTDKGGHQRTGSDNKFIGKILNLSELNDDQKVASRGSPAHPSGIKSARLPYSSRTREADIDIDRPKSELAQLPNLSMKILSEYEEELKKGKSKGQKKDPRTLDRIIEVNKIKSCMIEAQNKQLLSLLNSPRESGSRSHRAMNDDS